jgi:peptidyl-prolyl cis-trans isomerase A (cyclophilin A)
MKNFSIGILLLLALAGCAGAKPASAAPAPTTNTFRVLLDTSKGPVLLEVDRRLAPHGAQRFYELVKAKYFDGARFYRVVPNFVVQWGAAANPAVTKKWDVPIPDDPVKASNTRGMVTFAATSAPNSRSTHLFINLKNNARLDAMGFAPIGKVLKGMSAVDAIYSGYGEEPDQDKIAAQGNAYLKKDFPRLDYIKTARIVSASQ